MGCNFPELTRCCPQHSQTKSLLLPADFLDWTSSSQILQGKLLTQDKSSQQDRRFLARPMVNVLQIYIARCLDAICLLKSILMESLGITCHL